MLSTMTTNMNKILAYFPTFFFIFSFFLKQCSSELSPKFQSYISIFLVNNFLSVSLIPQIMHIPSWIHHLFYHTSYLILVIYLISVISFLQHSPNPTCLMITATEIQPILQTHCKSWIGTFTSLYNSLPTLTVRKLDKIYERMVSSLNSSQYRTVTHERGKVMR